MRDVFTAAPGSTSPTNKLPTQLDTVEGALRHALAVARRVEALACNAMGDLPTQGAAGNDEMPPGKLPQLRTLAVAANAALGDAASALDRLEGELL
jgi:hypothetical protein